MAEDWKYWVPGMTRPPLFLFLDRIEVELSDGVVEAGTPERFHWHPEVARGPVVRKWRPLTPPHQPSSSEEA